MYLSSYYYYISNPHTIRKMGHFEDTMIDVGETI
jgi:hypothetical protein